MPLRRGRWSVVDYPDKDKDKSTSKDLGQSSQQQLTSASVPASIVPQQPPPGTLNITGSLQRLAISPIQKK